MSEHDIPEDGIINISREDLIAGLLVVENALIAARAYFSSQDAMNTALHQVTTTRTYPLSAAVRDAHAELVDLRSRILGEARNSTPA